MEETTLELVRNYEAASFLFTNGAFRSPFMDFLMWWVSNRFVWIPLYLFFILRVYKSYPKNFWLFVVFCALLIVFNDQLSNIFKDGFERLRPTRDESLSDLVQTVNGYRGGRFGFFSAHAANSFAVAMMVTMLCYNQFKLIFPIAFMYAILVSFSRIYLGVHYPSDVVVGALIGIFSGWIFSILFIKLYYRLLNGKWKVES